MTTDAMPDLPAELPDWIREHIKLYFEDPVKAHMWDSTVAGGPGPLPCLLLEMTGAKSGQKRLLPLIYQNIDGKYVIVASKGGAPDHPSWYINLQKTPGCHIRVGAEQYDCVARTAESPEREQLWEKMAAVYPPYNDYQKSAGDRRIPVVVLDPK